MKNNSVCKRIMSNNFLETTVLKKVEIVKQSYAAKDSTNKFWRLCLCLNFYTVAFIRFSMYRYIYLFAIFPEKYEYAGKKNFTDKCIKNFKKWF